MSVEEGLENELDVQMRDTNVIIDSSLDYRIPTNQPGVYTPDSRRGCDSA